MSCAPLVMTPVTMMSMRFLGMGPLGPLTTSSLVRVTTPCTLQSAVLSPPPPRLARILRMGGGGGSSKIEVICFFAVLAGATMPVMLFLSSTDGDEARFLVAALPDMTIEAGGRWLAYALVSCPCGVRCVPVD